MKEKKRYKILQIVSELSAGGVENLLYNYISRMDKEKFDITVATHSRGGLVEKAILNIGVKIEYIAPMKKGILKNIRNTSRIIKNGNWDIVHVHLNQRSIVPLMIARYYKVKNRISHVHGCKKNQTAFETIKNFIIGKLIIRNATCYMACGKDAAKWLYGKNKKVLEKVIIVNNAIDLEKFKLKNTLNEQNGSMIKIVQVGRMTIEKNHEFSLRVLNILVQHNINCELIFVGDGPLLKNIEKRANELKLNNYIRFTGNINTVNEILQICDVLLLPSTHEGFPLTPIEAQAMGVKCILSDGITKDIAITELVKYLSINKNEYQWAEEIKNIKIEKKVSRIEAIRNAGFDINIETKKLEKIYSEM